MTWGDADRAIAAIDEHWAQGCYIISLLAFRAGDFRGMDGRSGRPVG